MKRHPTDFVELLFGLAFLATGGGFIVRQATDRAADPAWIAAIALVTIGCTFLAVTLLRRPQPQPETLAVESPPVAPAHVVPDGQPVDDTQP